ncbi:MAG: hypothetical protein IJ638_00100 [Alphaproteobacteria bacterium]|nr:hypothetical protein [Alphaproteobacteria bacterium]
MKNKGIIFLFLSFVMLFSNKAVASNCSYNDAIVYFSSPSATLSSYNPEYYCSDILYLINSKKGNIPLDEYKKLYPQKVSRNINYLRRIGITPNIFDEYIEEEDYDTFVSKTETNIYLKTLVGNYRSDENLYVVSSSLLEPTDLFQNNTDGDIVNAEKNYKICMKSKNSKPSESSLYSSDSIGYNQIISAIPVGLRPVVLSGSTLRNVFDMDVATIEDNRALGSKSLRLINFSDEIFEKNNSTDVEWKENVCKTNTLKEKVRRNSTCYLCPYIVMIFNEISLIFNYMYTTFKYTMIIFLIVFGSLFMVFNFLKGFSSLPFSADFSSYPKSVAKKLQVILIVVTLVWVPPRMLFSWTIQPVLDLTLYISDTIMRVGDADKTELKCDGSTIVDKINQQRIDENKEIEVPPIVKQKQLANSTFTNDSVILSKTTMGNIVCFLSNTLKSNATQMTMGEVLVTSAFDFNINYENRFLGFIFGIIIFGLYFLISIMISFYILDGLLEFLKIAIMWPFYVFGYAFPIVKFNVKSIMNTAKSFGLTMVNLAVFSMFNSALLNSFYFVGTNKNLLTVLNDAIDKNDVSIILSSMPTDLLAITQFLFIIYCIYYIYSQLGKFASSYGGSMGSISIGNNIRNIINSSRKTLTSVSREVKGARKSPEKEDNKPEEKAEKEETTEETNE